MISFGKSGYVALYRFLPHLELVPVLAIRRQRELGYPEQKRQGGVQFCYHVLPLCAARTDTNESERWPNYLKYRFLRFAPRRLVLAEEIS